MNSALHLDSLRRVILDLPGGLSDARQAALASFAERGFPTTRHEDWKYTDLASAVDTSRGWLSAGGPLDAPDLERIHAAQSEIDAHWLVLVNGVLQDNLSDAAELPGVALEMANITNADFDAPLADLNAALSPGVLRIRIGKACDSRKTIAILVADSATRTPVASQGRVNICIEPSASASILEHHVSSGSEAHYSNMLLELDVGANASCHYVRIQDRSLQHSQTARLDARLGRDARLEHFGIDLGGRLARNDLKVVLGSPNASVTLNGLYLAGPAQHVDNHTRIEHRVGPTTSRQEYRGVLSGRCRAVWNGKAIVYPGADGTDAQQANHNLLLSEHAEIDAKPELEIYADDVKAAHGTTVGQLDERALFYLRTRGIGPDRARRILTRAFAATVVDTVPIAALRDMLGDRVESRLRAMAGGEA